MNTVFNTFHNTMAYTTLTKDEFDEAGCPRDTKEQVSIDRRAKRLRDNLCGSQSCECAGLNIWWENPPLYRPSNNN